MVLIAKTTKEVSNSTLFLFLTVQCVYFSTYVMAKGRFQIEASGVECHSDSDRVVNTTCAMTDKDARQAVDVDVHFKDGVEISSLYVRFSWMYKTANDLKYKPFLGMTNITIDLCHYLQNGNSMFLDFFLDDLRKASNLVHKCPFKGHCYIRGLSANLKNFPAFIPAGDYYIVMVFYTKINKVDDVLLWIRSTARVKTVNLG